jgi:protein gp37
MGIKTNIGSEWLANIDWAIISGLSGSRQTRPMKIEWVYNIVEQCKAAGVPVFIKQDSDLKPGCQGRLPDDLWTLKELPG